MPLQRRAFTMLELLVSLGIIFLLATLIIVSLKGVTSAAHRADSMGALRQMMVAFNGYAADHRQTLMPGYARQPLTGLGLKVETGAGNPFDPAAEADASAYVWRLAPYLDYDWMLYLTDYRSEQLLTILDKEYMGQWDKVSGTWIVEPVYGPGTAQVGDMGISRVVSFGMNSIFVGGDDVHGGPDVISRCPWNHTSDLEVLAATRLSEVKNPAQLMVFAPSIHYGELSAAGDDDLFEDPPVRDLLFGAPVLRPPFLDLYGDSSSPTGFRWGTRQWQFSPDDPTLIIQANGAMYGGDDAYDGWPMARWGDMLPAGHLDGSVTMHPREDFYYDMRLWSPKTGMQRHPLPE